MKHRKLAALLLAVCMVLTVAPSFTAAEANDAADTLTRDTTGVTGNSYSSWTYTFTKTGVTYAGQSAGGNDSIQLRSKNSNSGIVSTTSCGKVTKIAVEWNTSTTAESQLDIYGKDTAYSSPSDLYDSSTQGEKIGSIVCGGSTSLTIDHNYLLINGDYAYIGLRSNDGALYLTEIEITWLVDNGTPTAYTVSFDANEGTGTMEDVVATTKDYQLPECGFTAPEGKVFDYWAVDGAEGMYAPGDPYTLTGDTTFVAQWKDAPVYTYMTRLSDLRNGDKVVIFYPDSSKVVTGTDYYFNNTKHELASADATVTDGILAAPKEALVLTVAKKTGEDGITRYTFKTADNKYLEADETHVRLVDAEGANTLFQLETASADTNSYYIKCDSATDGNSEAQYLEYYKGYFTVFGMGTTTKYYTFQFYAEPAPRIHSHSLTLDGEIGLNFKMELPELDGVDYTNSYMTFAIPHGSCTERVNYSESAAKSTEVRGFACYVNAIQMAEPITATFHYTQNGTEKTVEETYSVEDYFITFDAIKDDFSEATVALTHALADYGYYAQRFLSEQRGWELGKDYAEMKKVYQTSYDVETVQGAVAADAVDRKLNDNVEKISYSLVLDSATEIRVFFKPVSGYDGTFTVNAPYTVKKVGANYQVSVLNIPAHELSKKYTIVMTTEAGTAEITASVMSYVNSMLEYFTNDAAAQYAAAAIYYYAQAANTYLTPPAN